MFLAHVNPQLSLALGQTILSTLAYLGVRVLAQLDASINTEQGGRLSGLPRYGGGVLCYVSKGHPAAEMVRPIHLTRSFYHLILTRTSDRRNTAACDFD